MERGSGQNSDRFFLWIDAVGGYWVCLGEQVVLGQAGPSRTADVPILADLSPRHARVCRDGGGYLIEAFREVRVDGRKVDRLAALSRRNVIQLGGSVRLVFRRPHPLSATARLDFSSRHRTQPSVDAVLLMAETCVLGPKPYSHVLCPDWPTDVILYRHEDALYCRSRGVLEIDGVPWEGHGPVSRNSRVVGDWFSLSLEAIAASEEPRREAW